MDRFIGLDAHTQTHPRGARRQSDDVRFGEQIKIFIGGATRYAADGRPLPLPLTHPKKELRNGTESA